MGGWGEEFSIPDNLSTCRSSLVVWNHVLDPADSIQQQLYQACALSASGPDAGAGSEPDAGFDPAPYTSAACQDFCAFLFKVSPTPMVFDAGPFVKTTCKPGCSPRGERSVRFATQGNNLSGSCGGGRRPEGQICAPAPHARTALGAYFADLASKEAASIPAFLSLARELAAHGAPRGLVMRSLMAARDEARHYVVMNRLARRHGAVSRLPVVVPTPIRTFEAMAHDNAVEGCVNETFAASALLGQARWTRNGATRGLLFGVARDERRHGALSWDLHRWATARLATPGRRRLLEAQDRAVAALGA